MKSKNKYLRFKSVAGDWRVFVAILGVFSVASIMIAANAHFPLPYDEQYHVTLIQYYSHQLSPFIDRQPDQLAVVGDATRYGSYLSHYVLSFPLRVISVFTNEISIQVFVLRLLNIGFVVAAFVLFRAFIIRLTGSRFKANVSIGLLAALPATSLLAAHVNYDNLALLMFAALLTTAYTAINGIRTNQRLSLHLFFGVVSIALLGSLIKFTFLPLAAVALVFLAVMMVRHKTVPTAPRRTDRLQAVFAIAMAVISIGAMGLFAERYGGNVLAYRSLQPDCSAVQSVHTCMQYGPWARNHILAQAAQSDTTFEGRSIEGYVTNVWMPIMIRGLGGVDNQGAVAELPGSVLAALKAFMLILCVGILGALVTFRRNTLVVMTVSAAGLYVLALLYRNYSEFMSLHDAVAVQGRYLLPLVVPLVAVSFMGLRFYANNAKKLVKNIPGFMTYLRTTSPEEAFRFGMNYGVMKSRS